MKKHPPLFPLLLLAILTLTWIGGALAAPEGADAPPEPAATPGVTPEAPAAVQEVEAAIQKAIYGHHNLAPAYFAGGVTIEDTRISADGQWAVSYLIPIDPVTGKPVPTEPGLTVTRREGVQWGVALPTSENWVEMVQQAPYDVLPFDQKVMWLSMYNEALAAVPQTTLRGYLLPWDAGITRYLSTSVCHDEYIPSGNAHYAFDFYTSHTMWDILAIKGGVVQIARWSVPNGDDSDMGNYIVVKDPTTSPVTYHLYLHLAQDSIPPELRTPGSPVIQGQFLGVADDTGASTGHHLHLQVQVPLYGENYYWGRSVDFAFDDVDINDGHPRVDASYCRDPRYCRDSDVCNTFRKSYTSQNVRRYIHPDTTPPTGGITSPATGETYEETLPLQAWAYDLGDPGEDPVGIESARFIAFYDGAWREIGPVFQPDAQNPDFSFNWNWCDYGIPDGPVSIALRLSDIRGNMADPLLGLRHVTKDYDCHPPTEPPACQPASDQIALFSEINYRGDCQILDTGAYLDSTAFPDVGENNTRSILIGRDVWAELFTETNFHGRSEITIQDDPSLGENPIGNGTLSSLRVTAYATRNPSLEPAFGGGLVNRNPAASQGEVTAPISETVEGDTTGWVTDGLWSVSAAQSRSPSHSWRYGIDATNNYDTYSANDGLLTSPPITLPVSSSPYVLQFWQRYQTESHYRHWDQRIVQLAWDGGPFEDVVQLSDDPMGGWLKTRIDLLPYYDMGQEHVLQIRFKFDTRDAYRNQYEGWFIDDIRVAAEPVTACTPPDGNEPNDSAAQAAPISVGDTIRGTICPGWDVDFYTFTAQAGDRLAFDVDAKASGSALDAYLFLLDSDGTSELAENDDEILFQVQDPLLGYLVPRDGTYYLKLRAWDHPAGTGAYTLTISADTAPPAVRLSDPAENGYLPRGRATVTAQASDNGSGVQRVEFWAHSGDWLNSGWEQLPTDYDNTNGWQTTLDTTAFNEGDTIALYANAFDRAGNAAHDVIWNVRIDSNPPTVTMTPLPAAATSTAIHIRWSATDTVSGIANVLLEYSIDGGDWQILAESPWLRDYWLVGQAGHHYAFRVTVSDGAGNSTTAETVSTAIPAAESLCPTFDPWDVDADTNDNQRIHATTIIYQGEAQIHNLCNPASDDRLGDADWLRFDAKSGEGYVLTAVPARGSAAAVRIRLYASDGTTLLAEAAPSVFGTPTTLFWHADQNRTVYALLEHVDASVSGSGTAYSVQLGKPVIYLPLLIR